MIYIYIYIYKLCSPRRCMMLGGHIIERSIKYGMPFCVPIILHYTAVTMLARILIVSK